MASRINQPRDLRGWRLPISRRERMDETGEGRFIPVGVLVRPDSEVNLMTTSALAMRAPDSAPRLLMLSLYDAS